PDDVRLVGGDSRCAGGVEWYDQGEWRTVGTDDRNQRDVAAVVCRQLGCGSTVSVPPGNTTRGIRVYCSWSESSLRECRRTYELLPGLTVICSGNNKTHYMAKIVFYGTTNTCQPQSITAVRITEPLSSSVLTTVFSSLLFTAEYSVRLVDGTTSCSGTVEVFYRGEWSGLCISWWSIMAKVVCRELNCGNVVAESRGPLIEDGSIGVRLYSICRGTESSIRQCDIIEGGRGFCYGGYYHHVTCSGKRLSVRLVDGAGFCSGRVEVKSNQSWASVCEADFDRQDAEVVCREFGCGAPAALQGGLYGEGEGQTWDKEFQCKGNESLLLDCDTSDRENNTCLPGNVVGLTCSESVQLVDGAGLCSRRVEVKSNQSWASVCEADFDRQDAEIVCGELGCGAPAALQGGLYGEGEGQTWDKEFQCKGNESLLLDCDTSDRKHNTCLPGNAVGLTCSEPDDVRLVGGGSRCAGGVEWYDQGEWRTVGTDDRNQRDVAAVVCRQLGCGSTVSVPPGNNTGGIRVFCPGSESSLRECRRTYELLPGLTVICSGNNKTHYMAKSMWTFVDPAISATAVADRCLKLSTQPFRLVNGTTSCSGTVEAFHEGEWSGLLCEADFDRQDAEVVCSEFGCGAPAALQGGLYGEGEGQTWDKEFQCKGNESLLLDCDTSDRENNTLRLLSLSFIFSEPDDVRLVGGGSRCAGGVEWYDQGEWRTVGAEDRDQKHVAAVVCRQLGCGSNVSELPGNTTRGIRVYCPGSESSLRDCWRMDYLCPGLTVICSVRLVNGTTSCSGTVEVFYEGEWTRLCFSWWWRIMIEANVVCRELDCGNPVAESRGRLVEDGRRGVTLYSRCRGNESSIRQCDNSRGRGVCDGKYYHHVTCSVEVKSNQSWASVCEADFDRQDGEIVCGELGCGAPAALQGGLYGEGEGQTWDKEFQCKGNESLLLDCDNSDRKHNTCLPGNAVGLTCSGKKQFVTQSTLFLTWSEEYERQYRCVLVRK
uniref:SRCR domain-containing protein n=1 Tax=Oncorhynchus mykiss TaxID=8022 RepID=A0A8C7RFV5_ONCMY